MEHNIDQLTEKIYQEGVEKGNQEAALIVENAKSEAAEIVKRPGERLIKSKLKLSKMLKISKEIHCLK